MLDRLDAAHGKTVSVAGTIDVVDDRCLDVARAQEIRMQRVRGPRGIDRLLRRRKRLAEHLAAEHVAGADVAALAAEQVVFKAFELQQFDQFGDVRLGHGEKTRAKKTRNYSGADCMASDRLVTSPAAASDARKSSASNAWPAASAPQPRT